jgi:signal transduction histidine kinase/ActR/RegA family two-component response regulator
MNEAPDIARGSAAVAPDSPLPKRLEEQLFVLLGRQARRVPFPVVIISLIIVSQAANHLPPIAWLPWLALVIVVLAVRLVVLPRLQHQHDVPIRKRLRTAIVLSAINGIVHGSSLVFFVFLTDFERAIQTMLLAGLCIGAIATTAGYRSIYLAYFLPVFPPLFILWAWSPGSEAAYTVNLPVAALVVIFGGILLTLAEDSFKLFRDSFALGTEKDALNQQLRAALAEADAAARAKTRFLAAASHDLRQPLHTLTFYGAALALRPLDDKSREIARQMDVALQALASQFNALLDISRLDAGVVEVNTSSVRLAPLLARVRAEFEPVAAAKNLALNVACPDDCDVEVDEALFERVIVNLLSNALKYTDEGRVDIEVTASADHCVLAVRDTGRGIPAGEMEHVFEEFYQLANPHRDRKEGFGLGLSIVRRTLGLLELDWKIESEEGEGTSFFVTLPRAAARPEKAAAVADDISLDGLQVLAVDDEPDVARGTRTLLEELGCRVTIVEGTREAVAALDECRPDIVLVDFRLRDGDNGLATVRAVRERLPGLPAIMISGDTAPSRIREANDAGVELLHKPVMVDELKRAISDACAPPGDYDSAAG